MVGSHGHDGQRRVQARLIAGVNKCENDNHKNTEI